LRSTVSIAKCGGIHEPGPVEEAVRRALSLLGGLEALVSPGDQVLLKPNLVVPAHYTTGATPNLHLMRALLRLAREAGASRVVIGEGSAIGQDTEKAFDAAGLRELALDERARLVDFKKDEWVRQPVPGGRELRRIRLPRTLLDSDVVVNVPVMKTHDAFPATLGLKNMKGVVPDRDKKRFHRRALAGCIVDLNRVAMPDLTVIDGTVCMEGPGPVRGETVDLGVIVASRDTVAADAVACEVMGIDPASVEYVRLAAEQGLGCADLSEMSVLGEEIAAVRRPFRQVRPDPERYAEMGVHLREDGACTGCRHTVGCVLADLERQGRLGTLGGHELLFGQLVTMPGEPRGAPVGIGNCTRRLEGLAGFVPGCPPFPPDITSFFEERAPAGTG
jgi:uncharacterized protein (DUF362 family)